ncbi:actin cytoskeleton-regulatory complex protein pan-1-like, partial [Camellia sinensis]|uniref:actin cytoskeleton-regulatory complex protein pan-1-like n=1 Tax=Camellia sinensis TaxID=4442 RepID=UPI00103596B9
MGRGLVAGLPTSIKGWRPRWFFVAVNGGMGVRTIWKVPTRSMESRLGAVAEEMMKRVKEWREREKAKWDDLVQPSALFEAGLGPQPKVGDLGLEGLEERRRAQEVEDRAVMAKAAKLMEAQRDRPPQPIARERIRPRPRPLGEKDLSSFEPRPPPVDPVKEEARKGVEPLKKEKKKKRSAPKEAAEESGAKRAKVAPTEMEVPVAKDAPEVVEIIPMVEVVEIAPPVQVEAGELGEERARAEEEKGRLLREWEVEKAKAAVELESLRKGVEEERATTAAERGALQRELDEERAKAASEKAAYPDLCVAAVEQYKGSPEFQMVVDAAVTRSL